MRKEPHHFSDIDRRTLLGELLTMTQEIVNNWDLEDQESIYNIDRHLEILRDKLDYWRSILSCDL